MSNEYKLRYDYTTNKWLVQHGRLILRRFTSKAVADFYLNWCKKEKKK